MKAELARSDFSGNPIEDNEEQQKEEVKKPEPKPQTLVQKTKASAQKPQALVQKPQKQPVTKKLTKQLNNIQSIMEKKLGQKQLLMIGEAVREVKKKHHRRGGHRRGSRSPRSQEKRMRKFRQRLAYLDRKDQIRRKRFGILYKANRELSGTLLNLARKNMGQKMVPLNSEDE